MLNAHMFIIVAEIDNSDDLQLTSNAFGDSEELHEGKVPEDNTKHNSSNEEEELLKLTALDDFDTADQDDDDLATLNDLAWELASSTGRLTRCEEDFHLERCVSYTPYISQTNITMDKIDALGDVFVFFIAISF